MTFVSHVPPGRGEVGEVHDGNRVEVAFEMSCVVGESQTRQLRYRSSASERISKPGLCLVGHAIGPAEGDHLPEHVSRPVETWWLRCACCALDRSSMTTGARKEYMRRSNVSRHVARSSCSIRRARQHEPLRHPLPGRLWQETRDAGEEDRRLRRTAEDVAGGGSPVVCAPGSHAEPRPPSQDNRSMTESP